MHSGNPLHVYGRAVVKIDASLEPSPQFALIAQQTMRVSVCVCVSVCLCVCVSVCLCVCACGVRVGTKLPAAKL